MSTDSEIPHKSTRPETPTESQAQIKRTPYQQVRHRRIQLGRAVLVCVIAVAWILYTAKGDPGITWLDMLPWAIPFTVGGTAAGTGWLRYRYHERLLSSHS